jgi:hypothetical protein
MWVAEWLFTDFFDGAVAASRRTGDHVSARFRQFEAPLAKAANEVKDSDQEKNHRERDPKNQFRCEQFADEIELKDKERRQDRQHSLANLCFPNRGICDRLERG